MLSILTITTYMAMDEEYEQMVAYVMPVTTIEDVFLGPLTFGLIGDGVGWNEKGKVKFFPWKIAEIEW